MHAVNIATEVHSIIAARASREVLLEDDMTLGGDGVGLDSISIAEVLLDCEQRFGIDVTDFLADGASITVGRIVRRVGDVP
jgi:acyl carrier protein